MADSNKIDDQLEGYKKQQIEKHRQEILRQIQIEHTKRVNEIIKNWPLKNGE